MLVNLFILYLLLLLLLLLLLKFVLFLFFFYTLFKQRILRFSRNLLFTSSVALGSRMESTIIFFSSWKDKKKISFSTYCVI
jgi:hypothetical protein